jgi:hypothetical protein
MIRYTLFKNPIQMDTLAMVQYLHYKGIDLIPEMTIESNWSVMDHRISQIPSISTEDRNVYLGINEIIKFYEEKSCIKNLLEKSLKFKEENPDYRINDNIVTS